MGQPLSDKEKGRLDDQIFELRRLTSQGELPYGPVRRSLQGIIENRVGDDPGEPSRTLEGIHLDLVVKEKLATAGVQHLEQLLSLSINELMSLRTTEGMTMGDVDAIRRALAEDGLAIRGEIPLRQPTDEEIIAHEESVRLPANKLLAYLDRYLSEREIEEATGNSRQIIRRWRAGERTRKDCDRVRLLYRVVRLADAVHGDAAPLWLTTPHPSLMRLDTWRRRRRTAVTPIAMIRAEQEEEVLSLLRDPSLITVVDVVRERLNPSQARLDPEALGKYGLEELNLGVRAYNVLYRCGARSIQDVVEATEQELGRLPNFGRRCVEDVKGRLAEYGLRLSDAGTRTVRPQWLQEISHLLLP